MKTKILAISALEERQISRMFQIMTEYYEKVTPARFRQDLAEKSEAILLLDGTGTIQGFSTLLIKNMSSANGPFVAMYSGDTVLARDFWGNGALASAFGRCLWKTKLKNFNQPVYWFLISKGFRTYLLMTNNFPEYYPRFDLPTPSHFQAAMTEFYGARFGQKYSPTEDLIRFESDKVSYLKQSVAEISAALRENPKIRFFETRNPKWREGEELACIAKVTMWIPIRYAFKRIGKCFRSIFKYLVEGRKTLHQFKLFSLGALLTIGTILAASTARAGLFSSSDIYDIPNAKSFPYSEKALQVQFKNASERATRTVAADASANFESAMSDDLKSLRKQVLSITSADQLNTVLTALDTKMTALDASDAKAGISKDNPYTGADRDYRYYAAQILPLRCLRGFIWRYTPLAASSGVVESRLVTDMFKISQSMQIFSPQVSDLPTPEEQKQAIQNGEQNISSAAFNYVTLPYEGAVLYGDGASMQKDLMTGCYVALRKSAERIERLNFSTPIIWDNKMYFGVGTFPDDLDRYKKIGEAERHVSLAMKNFGMHFLSFFSAYSIDSYFKLQTDLNKLYVEDSWPQFVTGYQGVDGVSIQKRAAVIRKYSDTFILDPKMGAKLLSEYSWPHLVRAIQELNITWLEIKDKPEDDRMVLNPAFINGFSRATSNGLNSWLAVTQGSTVLRSRLTGRTVAFNLQNFYMHPVHDLKAFLPTSFEQKSDKLIDHQFHTLIATKGRKTPTDVSGQYAKHRNWYHGAVTGWDNAAWGTIFPEVAATGDVPLALRTMNQTWGGGLMILPLMQFIR